MAWQSWRDAFYDLRQNRPVWQLLAGKVLMSLAFIQIFHILALHATARGLSPVNYGIVMGFNGALIMVAELPLVQWIKRYAPSRVLAVGYLLVGVGCASCAWAGTMPAFLGAMALFTLGEMVLLPVSAALVARLAPEEFLGRYFGFYGLMWGTAGLAGSSGVWFYGRWGGQLVDLRWTLCGFGRRRMTMSVKPRATLTRNTHRAQVTVDWDGAHRHAPGGGQMTMPLGVALVTRSR
ncbi:MAG: MFS transporter [Candidatus Synoicihabitans palmerolidicus]|nr:MFS transporter [Candidatus Synoicihabitans palmerolidicus]